MSESMDWEQFDAVVGDGSEGMAELFQEFVEDVNQKLVRLNAAAENKDASALSWDAHQIKGSAGSFGLQEFAREISLIEEMGKAGRVDEAAARLPNLPVMLASALEKIRSERPGLGL